MPYQVYAADGKLVGYIEQDADIERWLASLPSDYYTFPVGGQAVDAQRFMLQLNAQPADGPSFFGKLQERYGRVPLELNPFKELRDLVFGPNVFFIKLRQFIEMPLLGQMLSVLRRTLPAGATFYVLLEAQVVEDVVMATPDERVEVFYAPDINETVDGVHDAVGASTVVVGA